MAWCGILNVHKPAGMTSRDVVNRVARLVKPVKVGHAGTLDPLATGVLVVCLGSATRLIEYVQQMPKTYHATFLLGRSSDTEDIAGAVVELTNPPQPSLAEITAAAQSFHGEIQQRPPAFSALKVKGQRAYKLARAGEAVELEARPVTIHRLEVLRYDYPELELEIGCSSGTYVRSLGRDLAESLGTAAVMSALVRSQIGSFQLAASVKLAELNLETLTTHLLPAVTAVETLPRVVVNDSEAVELAAGRWIERALPDDATEAAAVDERGTLLAIVISRPGGRCGALRNLASPL